MNYESRTGFTLIEAVLATALLAVLFGVGGPLLSNAYADFSLRSEGKRFVDLLRKAERLSFANVGGRAHGVSIQPDSFVVFRGSSYAGRDVRYDETHDRSSLLSFSGPSEIVFSPVSGLPLGAAGWVIFRGNEQVDSVSVNAYGAVFW